MKVTQFINDNGNPAANHFTIVDCGVTYFQSYNSIIVKIDSNTGKTYLDEETWKCSNTTSKHRSQFLRETTKETQAKIDSGEYILTNLNDEGD